MSASYADGSSCLVCSSPAEGAELCSACAAALGGWTINPDSPTRHPAPEVAPDIDLEEPVGAGAHGEVWRGRDRSTGRDVAVKVLRRPAGENPEADRRLLWRFQLEIEAAAVLQDTAIVTVHRSGLSADGRPWYAMDFVEGVDLATWIGRNPPLPARLTLFIRLCAALHHAHLMGVIHRDLKPQNVIVEASGGTPKVVDFGLASYAGSVAAAGTLTLEGQALGTPLYMAPEQASGESRASGILADVYALGAMLFTLCSGAPPYEPQSSPLAQLEKVRSEPPRRLRALVPDSPRELEAIIDKAMAREPGERYVSAIALGEDVKRYCEGKAVLALRTSTVYAVRKFFRRHWKAVSLLLCLLGTAVGAGLWHLQEITRRNTLAEKAYREARSLLTYVLNDVSDRLVEVGREDVLDSISERAAAFPWDLAGEFPEGAVPLWQTAQSRARIARIRGSVAENRKLWADATGFYHEADRELSVAENEPGAPVADIRASRLSLQAVVLRVAVKGPSDPALSTRIMEWLRTADTAVESGGIPAERICGVEATLLSHALPLLYHTDRAATATALQKTGARLETVLTAGPRDVNVRIGAAALAEAAASAALDDHQPDADARIADAAARWNAGLDLWPLNRDMGEGCVRCALLRTRLMRETGDLSAAKTAWLDADQRTSVLLQNWIFKQGQTLEEAVFCEGVTLASRSYQSGNPDAAREMEARLSARAASFMPQLDSRRYITGLPRVDGMVPELWPFLGDWMRLQARIYRDAGDFGAASDRFSGASFKYYALGKWQPENPEWLVTRCGIMAEWATLPDVEGSEAPAAAVREKGRELWRTATAMPLTPVQRSRLDALHLLRTNIP